jgi:OOP family OmpA-OmpF porin
MVAGILSLKELEPMKPTALLLALALSILSASASAQNVYTTRGSYLGLQVGGSHVKEWCEGVPSSFQCDDVGAAWRIFGGYQFHSNFALEVGYADLGTVTLDAGTASGRADMTAVDLSVVGILPLNPALALFGKFGFYRGRISAVVSSSSGTPFSETDSGTEMTFGFGGEYRFTPTVGLRAEWQKYNDFSGSDIDVLTVGLVFRFGG